jgi:hypothetical protein
MPYRTSNHFCKEIDKEITIDKDTCPHCKMPIQKWCLSTVENWSLYARKTGFKPYGPHRQLLDRLFSQYWEDCSACGGIGIIDNTKTSNSKWIECTKCNEDGGKWIGTEEEWDKLVYEVVSAYPDSIVSSKKNTDNKIG